MVSTCGYSNLPTCMGKVHLQDLLRRDRSSAGMATALRACGWAATLVIDATPFRDPAPITGHLGTHDGIFTRIVSEQNLGLLRRIFAEVRWALRRDIGNETAHIAVFCRAGRHRSVALATCLAYVLPREETAQVKGRSGR